MSKRKVVHEEDVAAGSEDLNGLTTKQEQALSAVISHPTLKEAALSAGISETTLWRYMQEAEFSRRLREARRDAVKHVVIRLQRASSDAVTVLQNLMMKEDAPASARITAARTVLDYAFRADEQEELKARIADLQQFILRKQEEDAIDRGRKVVDNEEEDEDEG